MTRGGKERDVRTIDEGERSGTAIYLYAFPNTVPVKDQIHNVDPWQARGSERSGLNHVSDGEFVPVRTTMYPKPS